MTPAEAKKFLADNDIKYILAQFVDIHGVAKTKSVPAAHLDMILKNGAGFAGFAVWGLGIDPQGADFMAVGDIDTLQLVPWQPGYARIVCDGHVNRKPWDFESRVTLKKQVKRLADHGWILNSIVPCDATDALPKPCYDYKGLSRSREFLERLTEALIKAGIDVYQIDHEDANGQFEINYTFTECLKSADNYIFFKMAASEIANDLGLICSFMPKPFANRPGNGMHMHMSISDGDRNLFADDHDDYGLGLSKLAYHWTAGLLKHAAALTAICAPTVNSYKRLVVGRSLTGATWAPAYISYGDNNRSSMVRIPGGRIELRLPDAACNAYLATAAVIAAGLDGVNNSLHPGEPCNLNLYEQTPQQLHDLGIGILPQNLQSALHALEHDEVLREALGPAGGEFLRLKHMEWIEYMRHVSDWEQKSYLEFF
jgi:glutamine synthetase